MAENKIPKEVSDYMSQIGKKGGSVVSERKIAALRENAKKAGRKKIPDDQLTAAQKKRRERYEAAKNTTKPD